MQIIIEVSDFYLDEDKELEPALKQYIIRDSVRQINDAIKTKVESLTNEILVNTINQEMTTRVKVLIDEFMQTGHVKERYGSDKSKPVKEWISEQIRASNSDIVDSIKKAATTQVAALKQQYDMLFATQIVNKIKEAGYLKDEIAKTLLTEKP